MTKRGLCIIGSIVLIVFACERINLEGNREVEIPDFNFTKTITFADSLSEYNVFIGEPENLTPSDGFVLLELNSELFTDYAHKQRLVKLPQGKQVIRRASGALDYPDGTVLTKTFYYYNDERNRDQGKRLVETRLLIKENGFWNIATYQWNENQTAATLKLNGFSTQVSWTDERGNNLNILYEGPTENQCMTCHQSNSSMTHLGPTLTNLNRDVERNRTMVNQLNYLQTKGILDDFSISQTPKMVNYKDENSPLNERGRAYLAMNCAHCHNPTAWNTPAETGFDFRHETSLQSTGILDGNNQRNRNRIIRNVTNQEMPFIGTTVLHEEGVNLLVEYLENL